MLLDQAPLLYAALFIGVLLLVEGAFLLVRDARHGPRAQINRRMQMLAEAGEAKEVLAALRRDRQGGRFERLPFLARLDALVGQSGVTTTTSRILIRMGVLGATTFVLLQLFTGVPMVLGLPLGLVLGIGLPTAHLIHRRRGRLQRFEEQFPNALDLLVRSLRVGHPFTSALAVVAREVPDPLGTEFGIVVDEVTYGQELDDALWRLNQRIDLQDLRYLTVAVHIQHTSGGNLAEILDGLAKVIRDRFQMFRKVKAITAEGRWSTWFLSIFPIFMVIGVQLVKPDYFTQVADHPLFPILAGITVVLLILNVVFMRLLTTIKV